MNTRETVERLEIEAAHEMESAERDSNKVGLLVNQPVFSLTTARAFARDVKKSMHRAFQKSDLADKLAVQAEKDARLAREAAEMAKQHAARAELADQNVDWLIYSAENA